MRIYFLFLLLPIKLFSQDIEGVWTGTIYNDTTRKYIPYEIVISENKGKLSGFSHTIFTGENATQETGVKSLRIKMKAGKILIEDDELIFNNYAEPPPKGVKQYSVLNITSGPSGVYLVGVFNTNRTKEYASLTGTINLQKKEKVNESQLIPRLNELNLSSTLSFNQTQPKEKEMAAVVPAIKTETSTPDPKAQLKKVALNLPQTKKEVNQVVKIEKDENLIDINEDTVDYKVDIIPMEDVAKLKKQKSENIKAPVLTAKKTETTPEPKKQTAVLTEIKKVPVAELKKDVAMVPAKADNKQVLPPRAKEKPTAVVTRPVTKQENLQSNKRETTANTNTSPNKPLSIIAPKEKPTAVVTRPVTKQENLQSNKQETNLNSNTTNKPATILVPKEKTKEQIIIPVVKPVQNSIAGPAISAIELGKRKIETIRSVDFKSDSIVLTLYDNGVIDGDTVSVILNGNVIMSKQRLTERATSKTVYITPELGDSLQLIMFAENLGSIAPNTGLLIIKDGEDSYHIRFAGDLQKNSAIILRRKAK